MKLHAAQNTFSKILTCLIAVSVLATTLATGSTTVAAPLPVPERGFISSQPATTWEEGLITGNGTIGANVLSRPLDETVVFTHERLFLPDGKPIMPPNIAPRLFELRRLIERGLYKQATQFAFDQSTQEDFMYPDPFVPAFDLRVKMDGDQTVRDYMRSTNFQTGVTTVQWTNNVGTFARKLFVSRKDGLAVMQITGPGKGKVNCRMTLTPRMLSDKVDSKKIEKSATLFKSHVSDIKVDAQPSAITYRNSYTKAYPGSIHALEGVAQVVTDGGTITPKGPTLSITGANSVLIFIDIELIHDPRKSKMKDMQQAIAALPKDFDTLLKGHVAIHGDLFNRVKLNTVHFNLSYQIFIEVKLNMHRVPGSFYPFPF